MEQDQLNIWRRQVWELVERNRVRPARDVLQQALAKFPDDRELLLGAAWVAYLGDENEEAGDLCERVLLQDPGSPGARSLLAKVFHERGALVEAETLYNSLMRDFPDDVDYVSDFALMLVTTVHQGHAYALARRAIELSPDHNGARKAIVFTSLMRGEHDHVNSTLKDMMESDPQASATLHSLIVVLEDRGDAPGALRLAQEMLRAEPDNPALVETIVRLQLAGHWSMRPLQWLEGQYEGLLGIGMLGIGLIALAGHPIARVVGGVLCTYCLYGAIWPPLLKHLQR
ncbi:MAG: tetratricopeptide repeat protein [Gammaproteobacteria bacterium]